MDTTAAIHRRIARLAADFVEHSRQHIGALPSLEFDPDWPSPCVVGEPAHGRCHWQPAPMTTVPDFRRLETALEVAVHPDLQAAYTAHWSAGLPLVFNDNAFELLQLWNEQDFENLLGNFIGHALEKKRVRQGLTLFFALVDDNQLLSIDNETGGVVLETLGRPGPDEVSPSLLEFLEQCEAGRGVETDNA